MTDGYLTAWIKIVRGKVSVIFAPASKAIEQLLAKVGPR